MTDDRWQGGGPTMRYMRGPNFAWIHCQKTESVSGRGVHINYEVSQVPDVRDPNLSSSFLDFILNIFTVILYINDVIRGGGGYIKRWHDDRGEGGGLKWPKKGWRHLCTAPKRIPPPPLLWWLWPTILMIVCSIIIHISSKLANDH